MMMRDADPDVIHECYSPIIARELRRQERDPSSLLQGTVFHRKSCEQGTQTITGRPSAANRFGGYVNICTAC
jgi:hypothetical protein